MSLVNELIDEVVDSSSDLSQVLRKALVLAFNLRSEELQTWAKAELNGYKNEDALPDYRVSSGSNFGNFIGIATRATSFPIPLFNLPEWLRESKSKLELREGVASLQEVYRSEREYKENWSADVVAAVADQIYERMTMTSAWKVVSKARIADALDAVRNRLLNFLLDLKEQYPEVQAPSGNLQSIPKEEVRVSVVNNIYGGQNVFASGGTVHQQVEQGVKPGDLESLLNALREASLPEELVNELPEALKEDEPVRNDGIGPRVARWLARVGEKVTTGTAATLATQALLHYYRIAGG